MKRRTLSKPKNQTPEPFWFNKGLKIATIGPEGGYVNYDNYLAIPGGEAVVSGYTKENDPNPDMVSVHTTDNKTGNPVYSFITPTATETYSPINKNSKKILHTISFPNGRTATEKVPVADTLGMGNRFNPNNYNSNEEVFVRKDGGPIPLKRIFKGQGGLKVYSEKDSPYSNNQDSYYKN